MAAGVAAAHFGRYYLVTSLAYDSFRAGGNAVMVAALGAPVLVALARVHGGRRGALITSAQRTRRGG